MINYMSLYDILEKYGTDDPETQPIGIDYRLADNNDSAVFNEFSNRVHVSDTLAILEKGYPDHEQYLALMEDNPDAIDMILDAMPEELQCEFTFM